MTIDQVYQVYQIPPNLRRHMYAVSAVVQLLRQWWKGQELDWEVTLLATLLHDMGNIVKFRRPFLGELEADAQRWEELQQQYVSAYSKNTHVTTATIIEELQMGEVGERVLGVIGKMKNMFYGESDIPWETRILEYADCVVTPVGIEGFEKRMADLQSRYEKKDAVWQQPFRENARVMQEQVSRDLDDLANEDISEVVRELAKVELPVKEPFTPAFLATKTGS